MDTVALGSSIVGSSGVALASSSVAALSARSLPQPAADSNHNLSPTKNSHLFNTHHYQLTGASCFVLHDNSSPPSDPPATDSLSRWLCHNGPMNLHPDGHDDSLLPNLPSCWVGALRPGPVTGPPAKLTLQPALALGIGPTALSSFRRCDGITAAPWVARVMRSAQPQSMLPRRGRVRLRRRSVHRALNSVAIERVRGEGCLRAG